MAFPSVLFFFGFFFLWLSAFQVYRSLLNNTFFSQEKNTCVREEERERRGDMGKPHRKPPERPSESQTLRRKSMIDVQAGKPRESQGKPSESHWSGPDPLPLVAPCRSLSAPLFLLPWPTGIFSLLHKGVGLSSVLRCFKLVRPRPLAQSLVGASRPRCFFSASCLAEGHPE